MDQYTKIQDKMSKIESSLFDLTNEILTAIKFLFHLRENSTEIVKNLNSITTPEIYFQQFVDVNHFILKYQNFLTEVNCKFEMLKISEESINISTFVKKTMPESISKTNSSLCLSSQNLNFTEPYETLRKFHTDRLVKFDTQSNLNLPLSKSFNRNSKNLPCDVNDHNSDKNGNNDNINNNYNYNGKNSKINGVNKTNNGNVHFINTNQKNNSELLSNQDIFFFENKFFDDTSECLKETLLFNNSSSTTIKEKPAETLFKNGSSSTLIDFCNTTSSVKVQCSEIQSVTEDNFVTEVNPVKLNKSVVKDIKYVQVSDNENLKATKLSKPKVNKTDIIIKPAIIVRKLGEEYDVVIENIKSPSEFYVSIKNNQSNLLAELENKLKLMLKLKSKFCTKSHENRKASVSKELGNYALYYSKCDEMWCRVEIINWCLNFTDDFVTVFLLDYGEHKCVSINDLQCMPECFKEYPAFTQRCHLHGVFPLDMDRNIKTLSWEKGSTEKMRSLTENSNKIRIRIAADDSFHPSTSLPVTLWLVDQDNQCINQLIVESKFAVQQSVVDQQILHVEDKDSHIVEDENLSKWNPMKEDFESYQNCYDLDINDPAAIIYGYVGEDYKRICPHFAKTGYCFKGDACKKEHQKLDPLGFTTDQEEIYNNAFNILPVPPPETIISVQVTCLLTFNQFCCIPSDSFYSGEEDLQSLLKFMNKVENVREMKKLLIPPSTGQIVIARYSEDCSWYRARILESQPEKDLYTVLFVDYGNKESLRLSSIRAIESRYLHLPFQAIQCFIFGIGRNPNAPLKNVMDYINERIYSGHITIEVVSRLPGEGTNLLVHVYDHNGRNIGSDMIAKEYAVCKPEILISNYSKTIPG